MSIIEMYERILDVIRSEHEAIPGRVGDTPLSRLASEFEKLRVEDAVVATEACARIIENPPDDLAGSSLIDFWFGISFLTQYLPPKRRRIFIEPYREKLLGHGHLEGENRIRALMGYVTSGGRLTDEELTNDLGEIRSSAPILWVDAAVYSRHFAFAKRQLKQLFHERVISGTATLSLCIVLHSWRKKWPGDAGFSKMVTEFPRLTHDEEVRAKMITWIQLYV